MARRIPPEAEAEADKGMRGYLQVAEMQSGAAATIGQLARLPESVQTKSLENDNARDKMAFELESKNLELMVKDRADQRAMRERRFERALVHRETIEKRIFWFVTAVIFSAIGGVVALCVAKEYVLAGHLANTVIAGGLGYQGGKSAGVAKQKLLAEEHEGEEKK